MVTNLRGTALLPPRVAAYWRDLNLTAGNNAGLFVNNTIPGKCVVTWVNAVHFGQTSPVFTARAQLFDTGEVRLFFSGTTQNTAICPIVGLSQGAAVADAGVSTSKIVDQTFGGGEQAGNGSQNLDNPAFNQTFNRVVRDSGSIIVGATEGVTLARASFSNYGTIVDANGWGRNVVTTGYTDLFSGASDPHQKDTAVFSGTSSATPIVTSAAAATISVAKQQLGRTLTIAEVRALLRAHGTAVPGGRDRQAAAPRPAADPQHRWQPGSVVLPGGGCGSGGSAALVRAPARRSCLHDGRGFRRGAHPVLGDGAQQHCLATRGGALAGAALRRGPHALRPDQERRDVLRALRNRLLARTSPDLHAQ